MVQGNDEPVVRPCEHNDWDDVRTRNGHKLLRCRVCQGRWKLLSRSVKRCMAFLNNKCDDGAVCALLHVRRKKSNIGERYEQFGESVLEGVSRRIRRQTRNNALPPPLMSSSESDTDDEGPPELLDEDLVPHSCMC